MQGMDGMALFETIHGRAPSLAVIILSAQGTIAKAVAAMRRGVFGFLPRSFESKVLLDAVADALRMASTPRDEGDDWRADIVTRLTAMEDRLSQAQRVVASEATARIFGGSGSGKMLLA